MSWPRPWVTAVVLDGERRVLLKRSEGSWRLPGGEMPGGLDWIASLRACLRDDTGIEAESPRLLGMYAWQEGPRVQASFLVTAYRETAAGAEAVQWFAPTALPALGPGDRQRVEDALAFRGDVFLR
jgi:ADP-ribose pyrophosphatase YjhB (NUDIX family)